MVSSKKKSKEYFEKIKRRVPKNIKIEKINKKNKHLAENFLKSRKNLEINFNPIPLHFGEGWDYEKYPLGYIMLNTENNSIVGFLETIFSKRIIDKEEVVCCSLAQWFIEKEMRLYSYAFFFPLLENKIIIYATAPRNSLVGFFKKFDFDMNYVKYSVGFGINLPSLISKNYNRFKILDKEKDFFNELNQKDKIIYQDHKKCNCINIVIKDNDKKIKPLYFMIKIKKRYKIDVLDIFYLSDIDQCNKYAREIFTKICITYRKMFIGQVYLDSKNKLQYNPKFLTKTVKKFFPQKKIDDKSFFDYLYSDQIIFDK